MLHDLHTIVLIQILFIFRGEEVVAVASLNFDPLVSQAAEFMAKGHKISKSEVQ